MSRSYRLRRTDSLLVVEAYDFEDENLPGGPNVPPYKTTLGALRGSGHRYHSVRTEIREHLVAQVSMRRRSIEEVLGFDDTVLPELERALFALHDVLVIGDRGQGRSTLVRGLEGLLDVWAPIIEGSVLHEHPMNPQSPWAKEVVAERGDDTPVDWVKRDTRVAEVRVTADLTVADLLGDHEPELGHGLVPAMNRGVVILDDLGAMPARVQSALARVLSERDLRIGDGPSRLPLDIVVVATMDRADYHEYARLVPAVRDRFGGVVATHYPPSLADEVEILRRNAALGPQDSNLFIPYVPAHLLEVVARFTRSVREDGRFEPDAAGSVRLGIDALEHIGGSAARRSSLHHEPCIVRPSDLVTLVSGLAERLHSPDGDRVGERGHLVALLDRAVSDVCRTKLADVDTAAIKARLEAGTTLVTGPDVGSQELLDRLGTVPQFATLLKQFGISDGAESPGLAAGAVEMVLEGLGLERQVQRERDLATISYGSASAVTAS